MRRRRNSTHSCKNFQAAQEDVVDKQGDHSHVIDNEESFLNFLEQNGLEDQEVTNRRVVLAKKGQPGNIGIIHCMMDPHGLNLRATCKLHNKCKCWVQPKPSSGWSHFGLLSELVKWLLKSEHMDGLAHDEASVALRLRCGHQVRSRKRQA